MHPLDQWSDCYYPLVETSHSLHPYGPNHEKKSIEIFWFIHHYITCCDLVASALCPFKLWPLDYTFNWGWVSFRIIHHAKLPRGHLSVDFLLGHPRVNNPSDGLAFTTGFYQPKPGDCPFFQDNMNDSNYAGYYMTQLHYIFNILAFVRQDTDWSFFPLPFIPT